MLTRAAAKGKRGGALATLSLRRIIQDHANACYVLAVMLERKRVLKQIKSENGRAVRVLIYEHARNGDVFIVRDLQLRLDWNSRRAERSFVALLSSRHVANVICFRQRPTHNILPWFSTMLSALPRADGGRVGQDFPATLQGARRRCARDRIRFRRRRLRRNERTRGYLDFDECERPLGVQLFGGNAEHMAEAARQVIDWVRPDFIDLNFGCPVNKVVAKNGGSALLKDCPTLAAVAARSCEPWRRCR